MIRSLLYAIPSEEWLYWQALTELGEHGNVDTSSDASFTMTTGDVIVYVITQQQQHSLNAAAEADWLDNDDEPDQVRWCDWTEDVGLSVHGPSM